MYAAYAKCDEGELGPILAKRLAEVGLQPNTVAAVEHASRQVGILADYWQALELTKIVPPPPLPGNTRVLLALCEWDNSWMSEGVNNQSAVRDHYGPNLFDDALICDGIHIEVCVRCAMNEDPPFTAALTNFLRALDEEGRQP